METLGGGGGGGGCVNRGDGGMKNKRTGKDMERGRRVERGEAKWEGDAIRGEETEEGIDSQTQNKQRERTKNQDFLSSALFSLRQFLASMGNYPVNKPAVYNSIRKSRHGFA